MQVKYNLGWCFWKYYNERISLSLRALLELRLPALSSPASRPPFPPDMERGPENEVGYATEDSRTYTDYDTNPSDIFDGRLTETIAQRGYTFSS